MDKPILTRNGLNIKICHFNDLEIQLHLNIKKDVFLDAIFKCQYKEYNFLSCFAKKKVYLGKGKKKQYYHSSVETRTSSWPPTCQRAIISSLSLFMPAFKIHL